ncbi:hypothetical protein OAI08_05840 [Gammaproteobacteria bacterium]|nr:hypothetical protein [Gammaproteobacteria bacterium]
MESKKTEFDNRANFDTTHSVTFRIDRVSKNLIKARAIAYGYRNLSTYIRDACLDCLPEIPIEVVDEG